MKQYIVFSREMQYNGQFLTGYLYAHFAVRVGQAFEVLNSRIAGV